METELNLGQSYGRHVIGMVPELCSSSWSENSLVFICEFRPAPALAPALAPAPAADGVPGETVEVGLPSQCTVQQLRLRLCMQAHELSRSPDPLALLDPARFLLLYTREGDWYEVYDDCQVLRTLDVPWSRDAAGRQTARIVVTAPPLADTEERLSWHSRLIHLIGHDLDTVAAERLGELSFTRRKLASPRCQELRRRDDVAYATEPWTSSTPVTKELQDHVTRKLPVRFHYSKVSFTVTVEAAMTSVGLTVVFRRVMEDLRQPCEEGSLALQVCGREEFLSGDAPLHDFLWVRHCLRTSQEIHLQVIPVAQLAQEVVRPEDWPLVDSFTGQSSSHQDLCLEGKAVDRILMISLWDCQRRFRVKLLGFDIPHPPSKPPQSVQVEVTLLYGNKELASMASSPRPFEDEVLWNEWLELDVLLRDLPRGAKLGLTILACPPDGPLSRDSRASTSGGRAADNNRGRGKVLYFVNLLLIDHRSVLSQGPHTLHMWPYPEQEEEPFTHQADKLCCATNPDVADAMAISFLLDRYSFPVVLPHSTGSPGTGPDPHLSPSPAVSPDPCLSPNTALSASSALSSPSSLSSPHSPSSYSLTVSPSSPYPGQSPSPSILTPPSHPATPGPPLAADPARLSSAPGPAPLPTASPVASHKSPLRRFREESIRYASNLPHYLRSVNWLQPGMVQDVHWLLGHWEAGELDLSVALELLSVDFPDEMVRKLAVQRLESLANNELLRYLLQLVQTLKVEPYHDSFLARFLIQRALRSKRIGHFFFWYLRSEVAGCAYFRQRMALVLEAYLLGCGKTTLDSLAHQVQAAEALQGVASTIKSLYPENLPPTAGARLQDLLRNCNLPSEFLVPFDPRIRAGKILLDRCKVMASKKKPLWLEFMPMTSPGPTVPPVGIIFKQGDDLRQDMLVLQTLVVMDSIWQEKSLDLNLVPYGCISTGHNMGMIEIVREAVTIAAVQRTLGGTTGAFKNDALFDWLKERCPLQEIHYQAMERFVNSCAGYCVATYVLGIGDRHNDNIMITDQGNLFHIDFGHILGNRKRFLGVNRERVPFVLTPDFLYVMGRVKGRSSLYFQRFRDICTQAYLSLRSHSRLLVTLFSLMLLTGIPELSAAEDMRYLREALQEDRPEEEAREHFLQQIAECEQLGWTVQANWWIHMVAGIK